MFRLFKYSLFAATLSLTAIAHAQETTKPQEEAASLYTVEVIGYGGGEADEDEEKDDEQSGQQ